jgi:hypothetical protein
LRCAFLGHATSTFCWPSLRSTHPLDADLYGAPLTERWAQPRGRAPARDYAAVMINDRLVRLRLPVLLLLLVLWLVSAARELLEFL